MHILQSMQHRHFNNGIRGAVHTAINPTLTCTYCTIPGTGTGTRYRNCNIHPIRQLTNNTGSTGICRGSWNISSQTNRIMYSDKCTLDTKSQVWTWHQVTNLTPEFVLDTKFKFCVQSTEELVCLCHWNFWTDLHFSISQSNDQQWYFIVFGRRRCPPANS